MFKVEFAGRWAGREFAQVFNDVSLLETVVTAGYGKSTEDEAKEYVRAKVQERFPEGHLNIYWWPTTSKCEIEIIRKQ